MKEILDVIVLIGFVFLLFVFLRGFNEQQVKKHEDRLAKSEQKKDENKQNNTELKENKE